MVLLPKILNNTAFTKVNFDINKVNWLNKDIVRFC
jgi:hypothetical protein